MVPSAPPASIGDNFSFPGRNSPGPWPRFPIALDSSLPELPAPFQRQVSTLAQASSVNFAPLQPPVSSAAVSASAGLVAASADAALIFREQNLLVASSHPNTQHDAAPPAAGASAVPAATATLDAAGTTTLSSAGNVVAPANIFPVATDAVASFSGNSPVPAVDAAPPAANNFAESSAAATPLAAADAFAPIVFPTTTSTASTPARGQLSPLGDAVQSAADAIAPSAAVFPSTPAGTLAPATVASTPSATFSTLEAAFEAARAADARATARSVAEAVSFATAASSSAVASGFIRAQSRPLRPPLPTLTADDTDGRSRPPVPLFNNGSAPPLSSQAQQRVPPPQRMATLPSTQPQSASAPATAYDSVFCLRPANHFGPGYGHDMHAPAASAAPNSSQRQQSFRSFQPHRPHRPSTPPPRIVMTAEAVQLMLELHTGELELFQPLDGKELDVMAQELVAAAHSHFGEPVSFPLRLAHSVLETARYLPGANGWPTLENALRCLSARETRPIPTPPSADVPLPPSAPPPSTTATFVRRASGGIDHRVPQPPSTVNSNKSTLSASARFRSLLRLPALNPTTGSHSQRLLCSSCGVAGHDVIQCPQGLDVEAVVNAAQDLGRASQQRVFDLSGELQPESASQVVRQEVVESISEISGISNQDISSHLDASSGDAEATFVSAVCHSRGGLDSQFYHDACVRELHRRRHRSHVADASRQASSAPDNVTAYRALTSRVNVPAQLGYGYRIGTADDIQLPPMPSRPVNLRRRRREDDLPDFVVSDHSSVPDPSESPPRSRARTSSSSNRPARSEPTNSSQSDDSSRGDSDDTGDSSPGSSSRSRRSFDGSDNDASVDDNEGSDADSDQESGHDRDSSSDDESGGGCGEGSGSANNRVSDPLIQDAPLTADSLSAILKKLLDKRGRGDNNGLLASKTPSFWDLGKAPVGGYFAQTFMKVYGEFRQFRNVFGKKTGVTFKNLIMEDMIPMIRDDLKLSRRDWRKITDKELIRKLKRRLGFRERDAYIAELESCPRLTSNIRDVNVLNTKFKEMAAQMLSICERARKHGVKLLKPSCKHVFGEAVKNCYRINQWFRLRPFVSIGDSVRNINSKLSRRLASAAEQRHENAMDEAKLNGVRSQIGAGTSENSKAPDRFKGKGKVQGGIDKKGQDKSKTERDNYSKKMDALYKVENELDKGRFWHAKTPFCEGDNCTLKFCQGCGQHQVAGKAWHDRPRCNCRKHPDFVHTGYFHDKWPNRLSIHDKSSKNSDQRQQQPGSASGQQQRSSFAGRSNSVADDKKPSGSDS